MTDIQRILLSTFKAFVEFCNEHNMWYFACGGTALGAVRHKGFIPWDDDMDVYLLRKDYDRFIEMRGELREKGYEVLCYEDENYVRPFARMSSMSCTVLDYPEQRFLSGPNLDVICMDEASDDMKVTVALEKEYNHAIKCYQWSLAHHNSKEIWRNICGGEWYFALNKIRRNLFYPECRAEKYREAFRKAEVKARSMRGEKLFCYFHSYAIEKELFPKDWFASYCEMPFDGVTMRLPVKYHEYLTQLYGDYMTIPDESKRQKHARYYVNTEKRMTLEEVKEEMARRTEK